MSGRHLNLAGRPFVNRRPVTRLTVALWTLAALLLIVDAGLYWHYYRGREDQRQQLARVEAEVTGERRAVAALAGELGTFDLDKLNRRTELLNRRIEERTFGWGLLFDRLAAILPADVRLTSLSPQPLDQHADARRRRGVPAVVAPERVDLQIVGAARRDDAILELLDALFADPAFEDPNLARESRNQNEVNFNLSVIYLPETAAAHAATGGEGEATPPEGGTAPNAAAPAAGAPAAKTAATGTAKEARS